jgi:hypothetical protein
MTNIGKLSADEYRQALDDAMRDDDQVDQEESGDFESEADRLAHDADRPRVRKDGKPVGSEWKKYQPLTALQLKFCQGVIEGRTLKASYRAAYNTNAGDATVSANANKLMRDPRIAKVLEEAWSETIEHLADDAAASKRYVLKQLLALSKAGQDGTRLRALELMGKACGLFTPMVSEGDAPVSADQLKRELQAHIRLLERSTGVSAQDTVIKRLRVPVAVDDGQDGEGTVLQAPL